MRMTSFVIAAFIAGFGAFTVALIKERRAALPGEGAPAITLPPSRPQPVRLRHAQPEPPSAIPAGKAPLTVTDTTSGPGVIALAARSCVRFGPLAASHALRLRRDRLGRAYRIDQGGSYDVFRETVSNACVPARPVVLVVGFRLRAIQDWSAPHWLFQRLCILTTPFWSGFRGFRVKLWMVDPVTRNYLGMYDWEGVGQARTYLAALTRVLRPLSMPGSVFATLYPDQALEPFLAMRAVATAGPGRKVNRRPLPDTPARSA